MRCVVTPCEVAGQHAVSDGVRVLSLLSFSSSKRSQRSRSWFMRLALATFWTRLALAFLWVALNLLLILLLNQTVVAVRMGLTCC